MSLTCVCESLLRSTSGSPRKNSQLSRSASRSGACGAMLIAFLLASLLLLTGQTSTHTRAAGAVFGRNLQGVAILLHALPLWLGPLEGGRRLVAQLGAVDLGADHGMRADHDALAALDAEILVPHRNELRDVALLPLRRARRERAARRDRAHRERIAVAGRNLPENVAHKLRRLAVDGRNQIEVRRSSARQFHFFKMGQRRIHGREVLLRRPPRRACRRSSRWLS